MNKNAWNELGNHISHRWEKTKKRTTAMVIVALIVAIAVLTWGCRETDGKEVRYTEARELANYLPFEARIERNMGNGWYLVVIHDNTYLSTISRGVYSYFNPILVPYKEEN